MNEPVWQSAGEERSEARCRERNRSGVDAAGKWTVKTRTPAPALALALGLLWIGPARGQQKCDTCAMPGPSATPAAKASKPSGDDLVKLDAALDRAKAAGDKEAVAAILGEDAISLDDGEKVATRADMLGRVRKWPPETKFSLQVQDAQVKLLGDAAVVTSRKTMSWVMNGIPKARTSRETNTYARRQGRWVLVVSQRSDEALPYSAKDVAVDLPFDAARALGDPRARVVLFEYSDYQCPFCRQFAAETLDRVRKEYVDTGRVQLVFHNYPLESAHPRALPAAVAAECAGAQGKFWAMNERLLREPVELSAEDFMRDARDLGLDPDRFGHCVESPATAEAIRKEMHDAGIVGVGGTPMFVIGIRNAGDQTVHALRMIEGAYPYEVFRATLEGTLRARSF
jgi:protein-disulfide isomerase